MAKRGQNGAREGQSGAKPGLERVKLGSTGDDGASGGHWGGGGGNRHRGRSRSNVLSWVWGQGTWLGQSHPRFLRLYAQIRLVCVSVRVWGWARADAEGLERGSGARATPRLAG